MPARTDDPEFWHSRAEEARSMAEEMKQAESKAIMERIADQYEQIAKFCEEHARERK